MVAPVPSPVIGVAHETGVDPATAAKRSSTFLVCMWPSCARAPALVTPSAMPATARAEMVRAEKRPDRFI